MHRIALEERGVLGVLPEEVGRAEGSWDEHIDCDDDPCDDCVEKEPK